MEKMACPALILNFQCLKNTKVRRVSLEVADWPYANSRKIMQNHAYQVNNRMKASPTNFKRIRQSSPRPNTTNHYG